MGWADDKMAQISRSQWENYKQTYVPIEDQLINLIGNEGELNDALGQANLSVTNAFDSSRAQTLRDLSRQGVTPDADQLAQLNKQSGLAEVAAQVEAANRVRQRDYERDTQALSGGISGTLSSVSGG